MRGLKSGLGWRERQAFAQGQLLGEVVTFRCLIRGVNKTRGASPASLGGVLGLPVFSGFLAGIVGRQGVPSFSLPHTRSLWKVNQCLLPRAQDENQSLALAGEVQLLLLLSVKAAAGSLRETLPKSSSPPPGSGWSWGATGLPRVSRSAGEGASAWRARRSGSPCPAPSRPRPGSRRCPRGSRLAGPGHAARLSANPRGRRGSELPIPGRCVSVLQDRPAPLRRHRDARVALDAPQHLARFPRRAQ